MCAVWYSLSFPQQDVAFACYLWVYLQVWIRCVVAFTEASIFCWSAIVPSPSNNNTTESGVVFTELAFCFVQTQAIIVLLLLPLKLSSFFGAIGLSRRLLWLTLDQSRRRCSILWEIVKVPFGDTLRDPGEHKWVDWEPCVATVALVDKSLPYIVVLWLRIKGTYSSLYTGRIAFAVEDFPICSAS